MNRFLIVSASAIAIAGALLGEPRHLGLSRQDEFLLCASRVLGKPVISGWLGPRWIEATRCPADRGSLVEALRAANLNLLDSGDWMFLAPTRWYTNGNQYETPRWKRLVVLPHPRTWVIPGSRGLTAAERSHIADRVLRQSRSVPTSLRPDLEQGIPGEYPPRPDDETTVKEMFVSVDARRLGPSLPESVVAVVTSDTFGHESRLSLGEIRDGQFELLWDSPLFWGWRFAFGYDDVDGDGVEDLLLWSETGNARNTIKTLSILTREGMELTRQAPCELEDSMWEEAGSLCPIRGDAMQLVPGAKGAQDILVKSFDPAGTVRYRLVNGRYTAVPPRVRKR